jgi:hypothetical protein
MNYLQIVFLTSLSMLPASMGIELVLFFSKYTSFSDPLFASKNK